MTARESGGGTPANGRKPHGQPADVFHANFRAMLADLHAWLSDLAPHVAVEEENTQDFWRFRIVPNAENACPVELVLYRAQQVFDLAVGPETYEERSIESLALFPRLLEAIGDGRVVTSVWVSSATGITRSVETVVTLDDGSVWRDEHLGPLADAISPQAAEKHDHAYVRYRPSGSS